MALRNVQKIDWRNLFTCTPSNTAEKGAGGQQAFAVCHSQLCVKNSKTIKKFEQLDRVENNIEKSLWKNKIRKTNLRRNLSLSTSAWRRSLKIWRVKLIVKLKSKWIIYEKFLFCGHSKLEADSNPIKIGPRTLAKKWPSRLLKGRLPSMISSS